MIYIILILATAAALAILAAFGIAKSKAELREEYTRHKEDCENTIKALTEALADRNRVIQTMGRANREATEQKKKIDDAPTPGARADAVGDVLSKLSKKR